MTAFEKIDRIRELKRYDDIDITPQESPGGFMSQDKLLLLKAFDVMREIAIQVHKDEYVGVPGVIDEEFEKRMGK